MDRFQTTRVGIASVLLAMTLGGCGMSSLTSGFGGGVFGGGSSSDEAAPAVTETSLLNAARADAGGSGPGSLAVANACPSFDVWPNDRLYTIYEPGGSGDGLSVIHRGELTKTARECAIQPGQITIKYGFSGKVLLGPKGSPGKIRLPIRIHVTDPAREQIKTEDMVVDVEISADKPIGYFSMVREIAIPVREGTRPADYRLYVAFANAAAPKS